MTESKSNQKKPNDKQAKQRVVQEEIPLARIKKQTPRAWSAYILPVLAVVLTVWAGVAQWQKQGLSIEITFPNAHGLKPGNPLRYRGVIAGEVESIKLQPDLSSVTTVVKLFPGNDKLASAGSAFWVVRPQLSVSGMQGLDTVIGARYIAVHPGIGAQQLNFKGLPRQRAYTNAKPGELDLVFVANHARNLNEGASISYRGIVVGTLLSVRLGPGGRTVEAYARIYRPYTELIRPDTVFWSLRPIKTNMSIWRLMLPWLETRLEIGKPKTFLFGGIALAIPTKSLERSVASGHQFKLLDKAPEDVKDWKPMLRIGSRFLPKKTKLPCQIKARITWVEKNFFRQKRPKANTGWLTLVGDTLWGPSNLFPSKKKYMDIGMLEINGESIPLKAVAITRLPDNPNLVQLQPSLTIKQAFLNKTCPYVQTPQTIKKRDLVLVTGRDFEQPISKTQMKQIQENKVSALLLKDLAPLGHVFQGAAAFARETGELLGILVITKDEMKIYPLYTTYSSNRCVVKKKCHEVTKQEILIGCATTCMSQCCKDISAASCLYPQQRQKCMFPCEVKCAQNHPATLCTSHKICPQGKPVPASKAIVPGKAPQPSK